MPFKNKGEIKTLSDMKMVAKLITHRCTQRQTLLTETDVHQEHDVYQKLPQGGLDIQLPVLSCVLSQGRSPQS